MVSKKLSFSATPKFAVLSINNFLFDIIRLGSLVVLLLFACGLFSLPLIDIVEISVLMPLVKCMDTFD